MSNKMKRIIRDGPLSPDQVAADQAVRRKVRDEFPPAAAPTGCACGRLSESLRKAIRDSGRSSDDVAAAAGVSPLLLSRFLAGERDIHMATADKLADALGLTLAAS